MSIVSYTTSLGTCFCDKVYTTVWLWRVVTCTIGACGIPIKISKGSNNIIQDILVKHSYMQILLQDWFCDMIKGRIPNAMKNVPAWIHTNIHSRCDAFLLSLHQSLRHWHPGNDLVSNPLLNGASITWYTVICVKAPVIVLPLINV